MPFINWERCNVAGGTVDMQRQANILIEFMSNYCLNQIIAEPTRVNNILDLLLTNNPDMVLKIDIEDIVLSDYRLLLDRTRLPPPSKRRVPNSIAFQGLIS